MYNCTAIQNSFFLENCRKSYLDTWGTLYATLSPPPPKNEKVHQMVFLNK